MEKFSHKILVVSSSDTVELPLKVSTCFLLLWVWLSNNRAKQDILTIHFESKSSVINETSIELRLNRQTPVALKL